MTVLLIVAALAGPHHDACNTLACEERIERRKHAHILHRWRRVTRPYRPWLARVRACESRGRYWINTGNGFFGAYQFTLRSWWWVGGRGYPHRAPRVEQDYRAVRLLWTQGRGAWPVCG